jgi:hypothetical protein
VDRSKPAGVEPVQSLLAGLAAPNQPDLAEHPKVLGRPRLDGNAHGFLESTENGQRVLSNGGDHNTSMTWLWLVPDHDLGIYVAYISDRGGEARAELWDAVLDHAFPVATPEPARAAPGAGQGLERFEGVYGFTRTSSTTPAKSFLLLGAMTVSAQEGDLVTDFAGFESTGWVRTDDDLFVSTDGRARMVVGEDGQHVFFDGPHMGPYSPFGAWTPIPWHSRPGLHAALFVASVLLIVSALVLWPVLALVRRRKAAGPTGARVARWWAAVTGGLYLVFVVLLASALLDYLALEY